MKSLLHKHVGEPEVKFRNPAKQAGFAMLYHVATLDSELSDGALRTFLVYLKYAQQKGSCWPGRAKVAQLRNTTEATITRHNQELEKAGYITRVRRKGTTSITYIEDYEQLPRLDAIAQSILASDKRTKENKNDPLPPDNGSQMIPTSDQKRSIEEEQLRITNKEEEEESPLPPSLFLEIDTLALIEEQPQVPHTEVVGSCEICGEISIRRGTENCPGCNIPLLWTNPMTGKLSQRDRQRKQKLEKPNLKGRGRYLESILLSYYQIGENGYWKSKDHMREYAIWLKKYPDWWLSRIIVEWAGQEKGGGIPFQAIKTCLQKKDWFDEELAKRQQSPASTTDPWAEWGHAPVEVDDAELAVMLEGLK